MKKFLLLSSIFVATTALAFGGIGIGSKSSSHKAGVDAIGIHITTSDKKADIDIRSCDSETEELVGTECLPKCAEGLERNTDGTCTVCTNGNVYLSYMDDPCNTNIEIDGNCISNADCESNDFCYLSQKFSPNDYPDSSTCQSLDAGLHYTYNGIDYLVSTNNMNWWAAENWCKAHRKQLDNLTNFAVPKDFPQCCGEECFLDFNSLTNTFGGIGWWTNVNYSSDPVMSYYINLSEGDGGCINADGDSLGGRWNEYYRALCK